MVIAIDGPAGAGKSTVARALARTLGWTYLDSGAMYRCEALASLRGRPAPASIELGDRVRCDGEDVTDEIRTPAVTAEAAVVAADPAVRARLVARQRELIEDGDWVVEGRDIGTVVAPAAAVKVFLTANDDARARRRAAETGRPFEEVLVEQAERDARDEGREHSPLRRALDAVEVDTSTLTLEQVVDRISALVPV